MVLVIYIYMCVYVEMWATEKRIIFNSEIIWAGGYGLIVAVFIILDMLSLSRSLSLLSPIHSIYHQPSVVFEQFNTKCARKGADTRSFTFASNPQK